MFYRIFTVSFRDPTCVPTLFAVLEDLGNGGLFRRVRAVGFCPPLRSRQHFVPAGVFSFLHENATRIAIEVDEGVWWILKLKVVWG